MPQSSAKDRRSSKGGNKPVNDKEVQQESSKAANSAIAAQKKSRELKDAAEATGDPDERQKLMEEAMDAQIQAESFGKTAKYLRSGTFQGMAMGTGLGVAPGASLGALTGTLVGGVSSTVLGGLGGSVGAATGYLHGPFVNLGEKAGKGIQKVTGINTWGWKASEGQKKQLEKMVGQINEQDMPDDEELEKLHKEGGAQEGWMESAKQSGDGALSSLAKMTESKGQEEKATETAQAKLPDKAPSKDDSNGHMNTQASETSHTSQSHHSTEDHDTSKAASDQSEDLEKENKRLQEENSALRAEIDQLRAEKEHPRKREDGIVKKPRKLEDRSKKRDARETPRKSGTKHEDDAADRKKPRKLERRPAG